MFRGILFIYNLFSLVTSEQAIRTYSTSSLRQNHCQEVTEGCLAEGMQMCQDQDTTKVMAELYIRHRNAWYMFRDVEADGNCMYYCLAKCPATQLASIDDIRKALAQVMRKPSENLMNFFVEYHKTDDNPEPSLEKWHDAVLKDSEWGSNFESSLFGAIYGVDVRIVTNSPSGMEESDTRTLLEMYQIDSEKMIPKDAPKFYLYLHQHRHPQLPTQKPNHFAILDPVDFEPPEGSITYCRTESVTGSQLPSPMESLKMGDVQGESLVHKRRMRPSQSILDVPLDPTHDRRRRSSLTTDVSAFGKPRIEDTRTAIRERRASMIDRKDVTLAMARLNFSESFPILSLGDEVPSQERIAQSSERSAVASTARPRQGGNEAALEREHLVKPKISTLRGATSCIEESHQSLPSIGVNKSDAFAPDHASRRQGATKGARVRSPNERSRVEGKNDAFDLDQSTSRSLERNKGSKSRPRVEPPSERRPELALDRKSERSQKHDKSEFMVWENEQLVERSDNTKDSNSRQGEMKKDNHTRHTLGYQESEDMRGHRHNSKIVATRLDGAPTQKASQPSREVATHSSKSKQPNSGRHNDTERSDRSGLSALSSKSNGSSASRRRKAGVDRLTLIDPLLRPSSTFRDEETTKQKMKTAPMDRSERSEGSKDSQPRKNTPMSRDDDTATFPSASTMHQDLDFVNHARHRMRRRDDSLVDSRVSTSGFAPMDGRERNGFSTTVRQITSEASWTSPRRFSMQECPRPEQTQMVAFGANPERTSKSPRRKSVVDSSAMRRSIVNSSNMSTQKSSVIDSRASELTEPVHMDVGPDHKSDDRAFGAPSASLQGASRRSSMPTQQNPIRRVRTAENNDGHARISSTDQRVAHDKHRQVRSTDRTARTESNRQHRSIEGHGTAMSNDRIETAEDRSARPARNVGEIDKQPRQHRMDVQSGQKHGSTTAWAAQIEGKMRATDLSTYHP